jgi:hypothetical protein
MFDAAALLELAETRFGAAILLERMRGPSGSDEKALELRKIVRGVIGRIQAAAAPNVGWPLPGNWPTGSTDENDQDISGQAYADAWPPDLLQHALDLVNWRSMSGLDATSDNSRKVGLAAEEFFNRVEKGGIGLGLMVSTEPGTPTIFAARSRDGASLIGDDDRENLLDKISGRSWDGV